MRWGWFLILVWLAAVLQTTLVHVLDIGSGAGWIGPELLACIAVFVALNCRSGSDAALAGWTLGMVVDLTSPGPGLGLLSLLYLAGAWVVFHVREGFFRDRLFTQFMLTFLFCLLIYGLWTGYLTMRHFLEPADFWLRVLQVVGLAAYSGVLALLVCAALRKVDRLIFAAPPGRGRR